jgi:two-component system capsular synthesis response regulator RcsB
VDKRRIRVLIADDHPVGRLTVELSLRHGGMHDIVGVATNAAELMRQMETKHCDVVVSDYAMPDGSDDSGLNLLARIRQRFVGTGIVVLTSLHDPLAVKAILDLGIACIVGKVDGPRHMCGAVRAAYERRGYLSPVMARIAAQTRACEASEYVEKYSSSA